MKVWDGRNPEMNHLATTSLLLKLTSIFFISSASADPTNITAEPGQNVTLPCRAPDSKPVIAVEWDRKDLGAEYVLLYRNNQFDYKNQHPSFKNRADLEEGGIETGDMSLVLRKVVTDDRGKYECLVIQTETNSRRKTVLYINLDVVPPPGEPDDGNKGGSDELWIGLGIGVACCCVLSVATIVFICFKHKKKLNSNRPSEEEVEPEASMPLDSSA